MPKPIVYVSYAEQLAAQTLVERSAITGRPLEPAVILIANARSPEEDDDSDLSDETGCRVVVVPNGAELRRRQAG
ncbi:MAG: hypothetical protein QOC82_1985 [Frankiaceae bacterium]|jgi:hypothetical protein|nr:hypothetical protein [Frankiaceae bacterium]